MHKILPQSQTPSVLVKSPKSPLLRILDPPLRLSKLSFPLVNNILDESLCARFYYFCILSFLVFNQDFVIYIDFTRVAASNTATDDVTS